MYFVRGVSSRTQVNVAVVAVSVYKAAVDSLVCLKFLTGRSVSLRSGV
jgi:hypothetical protein